MKQFPNAFWQTDLEQVLRQDGVEFVVVAGFAAPVSQTIQRVKGSRDLKRVTAFSHLLLFLF
jgi:nicotinamidase-related amidase